MTHYNLDCSNNYIGFGCASAYVSDKSLLSNSLTCNQCGDQVRGDAIDNLIYIIFPKAASPGKKMKREDSDRPSKKMKDSSGKSRDVVTTPGPPPGVKPSKVLDVGTHCIHDGLIL